MAALAVWTAACAGTPVRTSPQPFPRSAPGHTTGPSSGASGTTGSSTSGTSPTGASIAGTSPTGASIANEALALLGIAYRYGGSTPETGFDCSGLTRFVLGKHGITIPRTTGDQFQAGAAVSRSELEPGDLVFFSTIGPGPTHVGIVTDAATGRFVHAPADGSRVRVDLLTATYWASRWVGARRVF